MNNLIDEMVMTIIIGITVGVITNFVAHLLAIRRDNLRQTDKDCDDHEK